MIQFALIIIGVLALLRGFFAFRSTPDAEGKRKTEPNVAIAMMVVGVIVLLFAFIGLPVLSEWAWQPMRR